MHQDGPKASISALEERVGAIEAGAGLKALTSRVDELEDTSSAAAAAAKSAAAAAAKEKEENLLKVQEVAQLAGTLAHNEAEAVKAGIGSELKELSAKVASLAASAEVRLPPT